MDHSIEKHVEWALDKNADSKELQKNQKVRFIWQSKWPSDESIGIDWIGVTR